MKSRLIGLMIMAFLVGGCKAYWLRQETAWNHIETLKKGVLLVRLQTGEKKVKALREAGLDEKAEKAEIEQQNFNDTIVNAFNRLFNFCPVYFFYEKDSKKVKAGEFEGVLMDENRNKITDTDHILKDGWLMSEYALAQIPLGDEVPETGPPGASHGPKSMIVKDRTFKMLESPFPNGFKSLSTMNLKFEHYLIVAKQKKLKRELKKKRKALR